MYSYMGQVCEHSAQSIRRPRRRGFSLLELTIVVATIGVVAAMAVPRLGLAAERATYRTLRANELAFQRAIDLYAAEHQDRNPGQDADGSVMNSESVFAARLLGRSDIEGVPIVGGLFGPYLSRIPVNPYSQCGGTRLDGAAPGLDCAWRFDTASGVIAADHSNTQTNRHDTYPRHPPPATPSTQTTSTNLDPPAGGTVELGAGGNQGGNGASVSPLLIPD